MRSYTFSYEIVLGKVTTNQAESVGWQVRCTFSVGTYLMKCADGWHMRVDSHDHEDAIRTFVALAVS